MRVFNRNKIKNIEEYLKTLRRRSIRFTTSNNTKYFEPIFYGVERIGLNKNTTEEELKEVLSFDIFGDLFHQIIHLEYNLNQEILEDL